MPASGSVVVKAYFAPTSSLPLKLDVDGDALVDAQTDGALIVRHLRYLYDAALTSGALGTSATRLSPTEIEQRLNAMRPLLDVDQNGVADPFTDGVMLLRYLFGFRGTPLTANALGAGARVLDSAAVEAAITALLP
jgi:hypothetical protein